MKQNFFEFRFNHLSENNNFCLSKKNYLAFNLISAWPKWSIKNVLIYGPKSSGKTLICSIWKSKAKAEIIYPGLLKKKNIGEIEKIKKGSSLIFEDIDILINSKIVDEEMILFLFNILKEKECFFIFTSSKNPKQMNLSLADLRSRLYSSMIVELESPDDDLIKKIIQTKLRQKQITISNENINFLIKRINRDYNAAIAVSELIDKQSMVSKSNISKLFLRKIINLI